jgi:hypothetical protein
LIQQCPDGIGKSFSDETIGKEKVMVQGQYDVIATIEEDQTLSVRFSSPTGGDGGMAPARLPAAAREAMDITLRTLSERLLWLSILGVAMGLVILLSLIGSVVYGIWTILWGILALFAMCALFICGDLTRLNRWEQNILNLWVQDRLDLDNFSKMISRISRAPRGFPLGISQALLGSMLSTLPTETKGFVRMTTDLRNLTALTMWTLNLCKLDRMALVTLAYSVALTSLAWAVTIWSCRPLVGCLPVPFLLDALPVLTGLRLRHWHQRIALLAQQRVDRRNFADVARKLDWGPIASWKKDSCLEALVKEHS